MKAVVSWRSSASVSCCIPIYTEMMIFKVVVQSPEVVFASGHLSSKCAYLKNSAPIMLSAEGKKKNRPSLI